MGRDCGNSAAERALTAPPTFIAHGFVQLLQTVISRRRPSLVEPSPPPRLHSRMLMPASLITGPHLSISDLRNCPSSAGVLAGTKKAYHPATSKPVRPVSASVGKSGAAGARLAVVTASARNC